ncbi:MAG: hypothetical protein A3F46_08035 [Legionellales bacterium RIFCSPHIGHO2_12_FULL_42_9]|nr:MAG: hypothetical protein A3F46_08035 [Legionellales bacterium RIFCSPHIGHO2_12_FULL_42_9]
MKKSYIIFGLLSILILGICSYRYLKYPIKTIATKHAAILSHNIQRNTIVAPAIIDAPSDVMHITTLQPGIIKQIHVKTGQIVTRGQALFDLEHAIVKNNLNMQKIGLKQAQNQLFFQQKTLTHAITQLHRLQSLDRRAVSQNSLQEKIYAVKINKVQLQQAQHNLNLAKAHLHDAVLIFNQYTTTAPKDGIVLQINAHVNEFITPSQPIILLADAKKILVRVSIDERDIQYFNPKATAYITSIEDNSLKIPIKFIGSDRYIINQERLNSRVQEALYYFERSKYPQLVAGQQFDAKLFIRRPA